jgi:hypothetical protein
MDQPSKGKRALRADHPAPAAAEWREHEHVNERAQSEAERLLESTGTPELAKHAIDVAQERKEFQPGAGDELAQRVGFDSYAALLDASTSIDTSHRTWYVVPTADGDWVAWNETDFQEHRWDLQEAAVQGIHGLGPAG